MRDQRSNGRRATAPDAGRRPRADRIEMDISWSDQEVFGTSEPRSSARGRRSAVRRERVTRAPEPAPAPPETFEDVTAHSAAVGLAPTALVTGGLGATAKPQAEGRRTVVIRGQSTRGYVPARGGYEARLRPHERSGFKPDRVALWAVLLGLALLLGAVTSSHAATLHPGALHHLLLHHALIRPFP